jgi:hypothetical protein
MIRFGGFKSFKKFKRWSSPTSVLNNLNGLNFLNVGAGEPALKIGVRGGGTIAIRFA